MVRRLMFFVLYIDRLSEAYNYLCVRHVVISVYNTNVRDLFTMKSHFVELMMIAHMMHLKIRILDEVIFINTNLKF